MADTKLTDLTEQKRSTSNPPQGEDWLYTVDRNVVTDSAAGSSRKATVHELGVVLSQAINHLMLPGGRLTATSGDATPTADSTTTTIYYAPFIHDVIPLVNPTTSKMELYRFQQKSLVLGTVVANTNYDVFASYGGDPAFRASVTGTVTASTASVLPTRSAGDMLVVIVFNNTTTSPTAGSGWTRQSTVNDGSGMAMAIYTKVSDGTDSTSPTATSFTGAYQAYSFTNGTWADLIVGTAASQVAAGATTVNAPAANNYNPTGVWVGGWCINSAVVSLTPSGLAGASMQLPGTITSTPGRINTGYRTLNDTYSTSSHTAVTSGSGNVLGVGIAVVGGLKLSLGAAWSNSGAGSGARSGAMSFSSTHGKYTDGSTGLYLGTIRTISTTQTCDTVGKRFVWNMYNRIRRPLYVTGGGVANYGTAAWRAYANSATARVEFVVGLAGEPVWLSIEMQANTQAIGGVGVNTTTANSFAGGFLYFGPTTSIGMSQAEFIQPSMGYNYASIIQFGNSGSSAFDWAYCQGALQA